ncbi:MAG: AI-2E family transporter, partial [Planctomycetota bacterium]
FVFFYAALIGFIALTVPTLIAQVGDMYQALVGEKTYEAPEDPVVAEGPEGAMRADSGVESTEPDLTSEKQPDGSVVWFHDRNGNEVYDPGYLKLLVNWMTQMRSKFSDNPDLRHYPIGAEQVQNYISETGEKAVKSSIAAVSSAVYDVFGFLTAFVLIPIYLFYFLMGLTSLRDRVFEHLPGQYRDRVVSILGRIDEATSAFFKGRLLIMVIKGAIIAVVLAIVGLPYALLLGVVTGVGSLIPLVGAVIGLIPAVAIALLDTQSIHLAILTAAVFIVVELFENYALTPWILKDRVGLHPITILVSVFVAGALFGFVGMLLSVPIGSAAKILYKEFVLPEIKALAADKPPD